MRHSVPLSGFAHGSGAIRIVQEADDCGAKSRRIALRNYAAPRLSHDLGRPHFRRDHHRHATPHGLQHGNAEILRVRRQHEEPRCGE